jgi:glycine hydroxymethyltransferase
MQADAGLTATLICDVLDNLGDTQVEDRVRSQVAQLCSRFPVYSGL